MSTKQLTVKEFVQNIELNNLDERKLEVYQGLSNSDKSFPLLVRRKIDILLFHHAFNINFLRIALNCRLSKLRFFLSTLAVIKSCKIDN